MIKFALIIIAVVCMADTILLLCLSGGLNTGVLLPGGIGVILMGWALAGNALMIRIPPGIRPWCWYGLAILTGLPLITLLIVTVLIASAARPIPPANATWLIVLGAGLDGERPRLTLQNRLEVAADYLAQNPETLAIVTGGKGLNEAISEAEAMRRVLEAKGIAPGRIIKEERATSTAENLRYARKIIEEHGVTPGETIAVLSSEFHLFRTHLIARQQGIAIATLAAPSPWYLLPNAILRESLALIKTFIFE